ncbi:MAG: aldose epimerase [Actinobacteria bacterium]|nr:aldose epimerase [Actinomycetota bacterium]
MTANLSPMVNTHPEALGRAGRLFEIKNGSRSAVVTEEGAGLFRLNWDGTELLSTPSDDGFGGNGGHGQILVPWPGRIALGCYDFDGESYQLPLDDHAHQAAIHGFGRWLTWAPAQHDAERVVLGARMLARPGYPFCLDLEQSYTWLADRLEVELSVTNIGTQAAPFGYGCHPYFTVGTGTVDDGILQVPAEQYLGTDADLNPIGPPSPVQGTAFDFREPRPVGPTHFDVTFAGLRRDQDGNVTVSFAAPDNSVEITCTYPPGVNYVQIYSGDTLPPAFRRQGLAIEPYTCAPNAFNNGLGLLRVPPGGTARVSWSLSAKTR